MGARPGDYRLQGVTTAVVNGKAKLSPFATVVVTINGVPVPPPAPTPGPGPGPNPPAPLPIDVPTAEMQGLMGPMRTVMTASSVDSFKRATWAAAWSDFATAVAATPPTGIASYKSSITAFMQAAAAKGGLAGAFPGFSNALETAFTARFGAADGALDAVKAVEFAKAVAWACR